MNNSDAFTNLEQIAVIGMAGRFPGAKNIDIFWQNIQEGVESISFFTDDELASLGIAQSLLNNPNYIKASAILSDIDLFDAAFFGFSPSEAEIKDPQHRLFLECAWEALENAGYDSATYKGQIGIYAGAGLSTYTLFNLYPNREFLESVSELETLIRNDKDFLPTLTSYKLNLRGPSINIQTACSTSLVAIHLACQSLLNGESDMALAGGVRVRTPQKAGYLYQQEGISSPDGHCRAFDAKAQGTVSGNGVGVVVLKRLEDALGDGDCIHAIIKGSAINNDGSLKIGYTAPSINGQAQAIREALAVARISPETVSYIETHGTGTPLGDPIEIAALNQVFGHPSNKKSLCAIGSLKTNIGHLDAAAGVAGLIKTVLALKQKLIPPSLHFESPNPQIDFANSPFYVNNTLSEWKANGNPRRAGVSSFGIGGTNAHVILEEAPLMEASVPSRPWQLLMLSAKTESALEMITANIAEHFRHNQEINLADVAYTLQVGRKGFDHRRMVVCQNLNDAIESLSLLDPQRVFTRLQKPCDRPVAFMFPGLGTHYVNMAIELYQSEPTFRGEVDRCCELLKVHLGLDLRDVLYPNRNIEKVKLEPQKHNTLSANLDLRKMLGRSSELADVETLQATFLLNQTFLAQPAIFVIEYALAKLWIEWGIRPVAMIGYSIGEYVAACLAEVLSLEQALTLVAKRAQLIQDLPGGAMLAVPVSQQEIQPLLNESLSLSAINGSSLCVIGGTTAAVEELEQQLTQKGLVCRRLQTTHAFHSVMMNEKAPALRDLVKTFNLKPPKIPYLSNVTGVWITADEATDPNYWVKHLCEPVQFASGIQQLWEKQNPILLEVGPGQTLCSLALQCRENDLKVNRLVLPCLRHSYDSQSDMALLLSTLGQLWLFGIEINWSGFYAHERRHRLPLPTYPFERQRYWIEPNLSAPAVTKKQEPLHKKPNIADWFYIPVWKQSIPLESFENGNLVKQKSCWLVFVDAYGVGAEIAERLEKQGKNTITVLAGEGFTRLSDHSYAINPQQQDDYDALLTELRDQDLTPQAIAHFWSITSNTQTQSRIEFSKNCQNLGFFSVLFLAQVLGEQQFADRLDRLVVVVTNDIHNVTGEEKLSPEKVTVLGPCKVIPAEYPNITCRSVDVVIPELGTWQQKKLVDQLIAELTMESTDLCIAYRGQHRWVQTFEAVRWEGGIPEKTRLREKGVYLITGGFGGMGMALAEYLAQTVQAKLVLIGRSALPLTEEWGQWLATHDDLDQVSRKILKVQALEELGAEVLVCNADVAHEEQMRVAIAKASDRFGEIHGVIHAAGIGGGGLIQFQTPEKVASIFASKVTGTQVLDILFQDVQLDFFVLCSSQISILGGPGRVEYCAANAFQDAFAHRNTYKNGKFTVSINWDTWVDVGMAVDEALRQNLKPEEVLRNAIFSKEGVDAFSRILCRTLPQVVVSPENFHALIEQSNNNTASKALEKIEKARPSKPTHPKPQLSNSYVAPRNKVEQTLADIWQQLLGIEQVGIHDNFFNLGGDSDVGIQIIARANQAGFQITSKHIFEYQTIAELAEVAGKTQIIQAEQDLVKGPLPLAPNQQWFFEQNQPDPHHWNMAIGLEILQTLDPLLLEQGVRQLLLHHDALRLRFMRSESSWQQVNSSAEEVVPFTRLDFSVLLPDEQKLAIEAAANELQASLNLSTGPIVRVALFDLGVHQPNRLLIVIHHLVVDFGSWRILLEDLQTAYQQLSRGEAIHLPQKTTSFKQWSFRLQEYAHSAELQTELDYWLSKPHKQVFSLPVDYPEGINTVASAQSVSVELSAEETQALLQKVPSLSRTQTEEVLLTALVQAFAQWTGENCLLVDLEGNGRETTLDGINISRTVGWFTTISPILLNIEKAENPDNALKVVKEQFRRISNGGIDYGALHYLREDPEITNQLRALPQAEVIFVYLGQLVKSGPESSLFRLAGEFSGATRSPRGTRSHLLQVTGSVTEGQMRIEWKYSKNLYRQATVEVLAERFRSAVQSLIIYCQSSEAIGDTASDFERVSLIRFVRPRDTLELQIAQIWSEILDVHPVGVLDNFFALGGHSILALRLMARIQQQFGKNLPLTTLFQGPTVEHMATLLRQQTNSPSWSTLVALQPDGSKQPFFCIHPGGATVLAYIDLARYLGSEQPFYGLESLGLDEEQKPYTRIEEMAAHYIKAMQTVQPQGPYLLGGWSFGGLVAFEIAQQLKAQGQQVSLLALLDTPAPMSVPMSVEELQDEEYVVLLAKELANDHSLSLNLDCIRQLRADEQLSYVIEQVKYANQLIPDFDLPQARRIMRVFKSHKKVSNSYRPQPYPGKIAFFQAIEEVEPGFHNLLLGWKELADEGVEIHWVPGNHNNMVKEPHVQVLAEELGACLKQSQADD